MISNADALILKEWVQRNKKEDPWSVIPHTPHTKQAEFLACNSLEALYGGAAGGGKSDALLMGALMYIDKPSYSAIIFRKSYTDLALPGAIMDRAKEWLQGKAKPEEGGKRWRFKSGAALTFGYMDNANDKFRYAGAEYQFIGFDELTQFHEHQYRFLMSRLRRLKGSDVPLRIRSASNPGGVGHDWVFNRFVNKKTCKDRVFIPALLKDNPSLDQEEYLAALSNLDETTRKQLEDGLWVKDTSTLVYKFDDSRNGVDNLPAGHHWRYILGIDLGASQAEPTTAFCVVAFAYSCETAFIVESDSYAGMTPSGIALKIKEMDSRFDFVEIAMDEGALGKGYGEEMRTRWCIPVVPAVKSNKLGYRKLLNGDLEKAALMGVRNSNKKLVAEVDQLLWDEHGLDNIKGQSNHISDAMLYAWRHAKNFLSIAPKKAPEPGTPEYEAMISEEFDEQATRRRRNNA